MNYTLKNFLIGCCVGVGIVLFCFVLIALIGGWKSTLFLLVLIAGTMFDLLGDAHASFSSFSLIGLILTTILFFGFFGLCGSFIGFVSKYIKIRKKSYGK
ncbi:MAG: hypothetical protein Q7R99_02590 [bacterium]|nr:hypothetical protein [bacterium]